MRSVREAVRRLLERTGRTGEGEEGPPQPLLSYTMYWTKEARGWTKERRERIRHRVEQVTSRSGFEATTYERRYRVESLDSSAHAGASLLVLLDVLAAFEQLGEQEEETQ